MICSWMMRDETNSNYLVSINCMNTAAQQAQLGLHLITLLVEIPCKLRAHMHSICQRLISFSVISKIIFF